jgi:hypothetical protein
MSEQLIIATNNFKTISELYNLEEKDVNKVVIIVEHKEKERLLRKKLEEMMDN